MNKVDEVFEKLQFCMLFLTFGLSVLLIGLGIIPPIAAAVLMGVWCVIAFLLGIAHECKNDIEWLDEMLKDLEKYREDLFKEEEK